MPNNPNRSRGGSPPRNPAPEEIRAAREQVQTRLGLGITAASRWCAEQVHTSLRSWQQWEAPVGDRNHRRMHPAFWELFQIKARRRLPETSASGPA